MSQTIATTNTTASSSPTAAVGSTTATPDVKDATASSPQQEQEEFHSVDRKRGREDDAEPADIQVAAAAAEVDDAPAPSKRGAATATTADGRVSASSQGVPRAESDSVSLPGDEVEVAVDSQVISDLYDELRDLQCRIQSAIDEHEAMDKERCDARQPPSAPPSSPSPHQEHSRPPAAESLSSLTFDGQLAGMTSNAVADGSVAAADVVEPVEVPSTRDQTNTAVESSHLTAADASAPTECAGKAPESAEPETALVPSGGKQEAVPSDASQGAAPGASSCGQPNEAPAVPGQEAVDASEETIVDAESEPVAATSEPVEASAESSATAEEPEQVKVTPEPLKVSPPPADAGEAVGAATPMVQEAEAEAVPSQHAVDAVEDDAVPAKPVTTMADAPEAQEVVVEAAAPQAEAE